MKTIKYITLLSILIITACGKDSSFSYPQTFTLSGIEFTHEAAYEVILNNKTKKIDINSPSFNYITKSYITQEFEKLRNSKEDVFFPENIEFISNNSLKLGLKNFKTGEFQYIPLTGDVESENGIIIPISGSNPNLNVNFKFDKNTNKLTWAFEYVQHINVTDSRFNQDYLESCTDPVFENRINGLINKLTISQGDSIGLRYINYVFVK